MTTAEAEQMVAGYMHRLRDQQRIHAWHVMHELNIWIDKDKRIRSAGELLGESAPRKLVPDARTLQRMWMSDPKMR